MRRESTNSQARPLFMRFSARRARYSRARFIGYLVQLAEHLVYTEKVSGSTPLVPITSSRARDSKMRTMWLNTRFPLGGILSWSKTNRGAVSFHPPGEDFTWWNKIPPPGFSGNVLIFHLL